MVNLESNGTTQCISTAPPLTLRSGETERMARSQNTITSREVLRGRFLKFVSPEPNSGCWLWMGGCNHDGYGNFGVDGRTESSHRIAYLFEKGVIPVGLELDHKCRIKSCCNPDHLEPVTHHENIRRAGSWSLANAAACISKRAATHCINGHEYIESNTGWYKGHRYCRVCNRAYNALTYRKRMDRKRAGSYEISN